MTLHSPPVIASSFSCTRPDSRRRISCSANSAALLQARSRAGQGRAVGQGGAGSGQANDEGQLGWKGGGVVCQRNSRVEQHRGSDSSSAQHTKAWYSGRRQRQKTADSGGGGGGDSTHLTSSCMIIRTRAPCRVVRRMGAACRQDSGTHTRSSSGAQRAQRAGASQGRSRVQSQLRILCFCEVQAACCCTRSCHSGRWQLPAGSRHIMTAVRVLTWRHMDRTPLTISCPPRSVSSSRS